MDKGRYTVAPMADNVVDTKVPLTPLGSDRPMGGGNNRVPAIRIKTFYGDPKRYIEWKREVAATQTLYQISDDKLAGLVYLALARGEGKPRDLLSHLEVSDLCTTSGLKAVLAILDKEYKRDPHVQADDAQARYEKCRRTPHQTMAEYLRELRLSKRLLEREDPGTTISDVSFARKMLTKAGHLC